MLGTAPAPASPSAAPAPAADSSTLWLAPARVAQGSFGWTGALAAVGLVGVLIALAVGYRRLRDSGA